MSLGNGYQNNPTRSDVLVTSDWVANHLQHPNIRLVESNEDPMLYGTGHIPGAVNIDWQADLNDPLTRDYIGAQEFAALLSRFGICPETTVVFYGDKNNWFATYAFWAFQLFGHTNVKIMDGGRTKWIDENRSLTTSNAKTPATIYPLPRRDDSKIRAFRDQVFNHQAAGGTLLDVRSALEYTGELLHMANYPQEGALRSGHIPGAKNVPWASATNADGTFKSNEELQSIYIEEVGLNKHEEIITYCRIGERSSHTWFVLTYLLGFANVRNYDGSWTEWGNSVRMPIER